MCPLGFQEASSGSGVYGGAQPGCIRERLRRPSGSACPAYDDAPRWIRARVHGPPRSDEPHDRLRLLLRAAPVD